jgi:hypothetical protein
MRSNLNQLLPRAVFVACLFIGACTAFAASTTPQSFSDQESMASYNPGASYPGEYIQTRIYYRNPNSPIWRRMSISDDYRDVVACQSALVALQATGAWQGHLSQDGSCGPKDEPSFFALGNRINYDVLTNQEN